MAERLAEGEARRVKEAIDLVDLMGDYSQVVRAGAMFKACCPFHQERTPSLVIYQEDQHYHCYGCGAHGDAIDLIREQEQIEFVEAIEHLARRAGIALRYEQVTNQSGTGRARPAVPRGDRERMLAAMEWTTKHYIQQLWSDPAGEAARAYLAKRGLDRETCEAFRLGWAPGRGFLVNTALRARADLRILEQVNVALERNGGHADRFHERLMFPICNRQGRPVAFSGRLLPEAEAAAKAAGRGVGKYINSTDTPLYHKGSVVFNLHRARKHVRTARRLVVMEGPTDVMAAEQAGFGECVAVLGTALTSEHATQLGRQVGNAGKLVLLFDGDAAGQANSLKAVRTCLAAGMPCHVAIMPEGADPAELLAQPGGVERFERILEAVLPDVRHLLHALAPAPSSLDPRQRLAVADQLLDALRGLDDAQLRGLYLREIGEHLDLESQVLAVRLASTGESAASATTAPAPSDTLVDGLDASLDALLHLLVRRDDLRGALFDEHGLEPNIVPVPWRAVVDLLLAAPDRPGKALIDEDRVAQDATVRAAVFRWLRSDTLRTGQHVTEGDHLIADLLPQVTATSLDRQILQVESELKRAESFGDHAAAGELFPKLLALQRDRRAIVDD